MKRVYHIVFKEHEKDHMSKGKNYTAKDIVAAYGKWLTDTTPDAVFIAMYDLNALADIKGGTQVEVKQEEDIDGNILY
jgi:hypothetical protein